MGLRVMLIDSSEERSAIIEQALTDHGYQVVGRAGRGDDLLKRVQESQPEVIIIDLDSPDRDTLEHMRTISRDQPKPIVMFAENGDSRTIEEAIQAGVSAYIVDGLNSQRVKPIVDVAIARFREYQALRDELEKARSSLAERKLVERAKGVLMQQKGMTEEEAYQALRKTAMQNNTRIGEVARNIIALSDLLG